MKKIYTIGILLMLLTISITGATIISDAKSTIDGGLIVSGGNIPFNLTGGQKIINTGYDGRALDITQNRLSPAMYVETTNNSPNAFASDFRETSQGSSTNRVVMCTGGDADRKTLYVYRNVPAANNAQPVVQLIQGHAGDDQITLRVTNAGTGHVQTWYNSTALIAYVNNTGGIFAKAYNDFTPFTEKTNQQLKNEAKAIKSKDGKIDHSSLPEGTHGVTIEPIEEKYFNETTDMIESRVIGYEEVEVRDLGATVTWLQQMVQMQQEEIETLQTELCKKDATYKFCS